MHCKQYNKFIMYEFSTVQGNLCNLEQNKEEKNSHLNIACVYII